VHADAEIKRIGGIFVEVGDLTLDCARACDRGWLIGECGHDAIACMLHLAAMAGEQLGAHQRIVGAHEIDGSGVAKPIGHAHGVDDVSEHNDAMRRFRDRLIGRHDRVRVADAAEEDVTVETETVTAVFTNRGAVLKSWKLKHYLDDHKRPALWPACCSIGPTRA
jgi:hypothetical protein